MRFILLLACVVIGMNCSLASAFQPTDSVVVAINPPAATKTVYSDLIPVAAGFVLTTIIGGFFAHHLQNRSWQFQRRESLRDLHQTEATKIFDEVSRLLDRRQYRMSLVRWTLEREPLDEQLLNARWKKYRAVLFQWNDSVNRNRALVLRFFGREASERFELGIGEAFVKYGKMLERHYGNRCITGLADRNALDLLAKNLNDAIWQFDDTLVEQIKEGRVGAFLAEKHGATKSLRW